MATQSYRERMKAQRAAAGAKREAEQAEWHRRAELRYEVRRLAMDAVKAGITARGDKLSLYSLKSTPRAGECDNRALARGPGEGADRGGWPLDQRLRNVAQRRGGLTGSHRCGLARYES